MKTISKIFLAVISVLTLMAVMVFAISAAGDESDGVVTYVTNGDGATVDYNQDTAPDATFDFSTFFGDKRGKGVLSEETIDGNVVAVIDMNKAVGTEYYELKPNGASFTPASKYHILEFDIALDSADNFWGAAMGDFLFTPYGTSYTPAYDKNGNFLGASSERKFFGTSYADELCIGSWGTMNYVPTSIALKRSKIWTRLTMIVEYRVGTPEKKSLPVYSNRWNKTDEMVELDCVPVSAYIHYFVNGAFSKSTNEFKLGYEGYFPNDENIYGDDCIKMEGIRMEWEYSGDTKVRFDNFRYISVSKDTDIDLTSYFASEQNINGAALGSSGVYVNEIPTANVYGLSIKEPGLSTVGVTLDDGANVNANFTIDTNWLKKWPGAKVVFSNGTSIDALAGANTYTAELTPAQINDTLTAKLVFGDKLVFEERDVSISTYKEKVETSSSTALGLSEEKHSALKSLLNATMAYADAADGNSTELTDDFANAAALVLNQEKSVFLGFSGKLSASAGIYLKVDKANVLDTDTLTVKIGDTTLVDGVLASSKIDAESQIAIEGLYPLNFNDTVTVTLGTSSVSFTLETYLKAAYGATDMTNVKNMAVATYLYGIVAEAYNSAQ